MKREITVRLPEKQAKELADAVDVALESDDVRIVISAWGFELNLYEIGPFSGVKGFINDTSGG